MAIDSHPRMWRHHARAATTQPSSFFLRRLSALLEAIDSQCPVQDMDCQPEAAGDDEVIYFVNRDSAWWVEQHVKRRVYIELKLECYSNRTRNVHKARDDWLCVYCRGSFLSKLRLTDHRVGGCPSGPVGLSGLKVELPVYPNLKTAKQGKDLKAALQRGEGDVWDNLLDDSVWFDLNPELTDITTPPAGARVQKRWFMEESLETLRACPPPIADCMPPPRSKPPLPPRQPDIVDLPDDETEPESPPPRPNKRRHVHMPDGHRPYHSTRQLNTPPRKHNLVHR